MKHKPTPRPWFCHNMVKAMGDEKCRNEFWITDNPEDDGSGAIIASGLTRANAELITQCVNADQMKRRTKR